ncbi:MAG: hypothetical protein QF492_05965, partial [Candidatus Krumholzibacteria bacterium]|nr:hypothetical protein [Candidatus Krumholzibacteria bacterium]
MRLAIVCLSVLLVLPSLALEESHTLLRFYIESEEDMNYILINPDELDITESGRAWDYYDIVVQREDYMKLTLRGSRIEVLQDDLERNSCTRLPLFEYKRLSKATTLIQSGQTSFFRSDVCRIRDQR